MYMRCHPSLDRGSVRKATPSTNTPEVSHLGMGMIWRHTLQHGSTDAWTQREEGAGEGRQIAPPRLHAVTELHPAKHVLSGTAHTWPSWRHRTLQQESNLEENTACSI